MQGNFTQEDTETEWCERRLLARIHRYTVKQLRREIKPVTIAEFMRFLFEWQHLTPNTQFEGSAAVFSVLEQLEGFVASAASWEKSILKDRIRNYQPEWLDQCCLSGQFTWLRGKNRVTLNTEKSAARNITSLKTTPITFLQRTHLHELRPYCQAEQDVEILSSSAQQVYQQLKTRGASFHDELFQAIGGLQSMFDSALAELITNGLVTADSFSGLRKFLRSSQQSKRLQRARRRAPVHFVDASVSGRWSIIEGPIIPAITSEDDVAVKEHFQQDTKTIETIAMTLLKRYGIIFRKLVDRENGLPPWRDLLMTYRRLEAQGLIRGGRFVSSVSGEQFALPEAVGSLRKIRNQKTSSNSVGELTSICAADPLNLTGILIPCPRVPSQGDNRIVFRDGIPVASKTGKEIKLLQENSGLDDWTIRNALQ